MPAPAADPSDLSDLASVESFLSLPSGNADEPMLQMLITGISGEVVSYCERESFMAVASATETRNGNGRNAIASLNSPVWAVASVAVDTFLVPQATTALLSGWVLDTDFGPPPTSFIRMRGYPSVIAAAFAFWGPLRFTQGAQNVVIVESYGYNTPGMVKLSTTVSGAPTLPIDIKLATTELVAMRYRQSKRWGETGLGMGSERVNYFIKGFPDSVEMKLKRWKQVAPVVP